MRLLSLGLGLVLVVVMGCGPVVPPPEAVLAGTWELTTSTDQGITDVLLTFDERGDLARVSLKVGGVSFSDNNPNSRTNVNGSAVTIDSTVLGNGLVFNGTLNNGLNEATGALSFRIRMWIPPIDLSISDETARLRKLE